MYSTAYSAGSGLPYPGPPMQSPGAVTHPGWGISRESKAGLAAPTGSQSSSRLGGVAHRNGRSKTKFGISKGNSASTRNDFDPMVGDSVLMADFRYDLQQQKRFSNRQLGTNVDTLDASVPLVGGPVPNGQGLSMDPRQLSNSSQAPTYHPYFTDGVQAHAIDYKNTPVEKLASPNRPALPPAATPPRHALVTGLESHNNVPYPPTNTQIQMRNMRGNMIAMMEERLAHQNAQGHLGNGTTRASQLEHAPEHIKNIAANLIQEYDSIGNSNVSHAEFQHNMSNLPSTIKAEKLRSPSRNVRRGDLTWPENNLRFIPPSPKAVPISSSTNQTDGEDQIGSEPVGGLGDSPKPKFDGTTTEWESYLSSRKLKDEEGKENLPDNIVDGNKVIQEKLKDIVAMKEEIDEERLQASRKADWKAYNQYEQYAGEDIVRFEETMDPKSKESNIALAGETVSHASATVPPQIPTHPRFSNTIPPPFPPSARQSLHFVPQKQPQPQMVRRTARAFYDSLDGPFGAFPQQNNVFPVYNQEVNAVPVYDQQFNVATGHPPQNNLGANFDSAQERMINNSLGVDSVDARSQDFQMPKVSRVPMEQIEQWRHGRDDSNLNSMDNHVKLAQQKSQEHVSRKNEPAIIGQVEVYPNRNIVHEFNVKGGLHPRKIEQQPFQLGPKSVAEDEILKKHYEKLKSMVLADRDISHGIFPGVPQSSADVSVADDVKPPMSIANAQPVQFDTAEKKLNLTKRRPFSNFLHRNNADNYIMQHPLARQILSSFATIRNSEKARNPEQLAEGDATPKIPAEVPKVVEDDLVIEKEYQRLQEKAKSRVLQSKKEKEIVEARSNKAKKYSNESKTKPTYFDPDRDMYKNSRNKPVTRKMWEKKSLERRQADFEAKARRERLRRQQKSYLQDRRDSYVASGDQENRAIPEDSSSEDEEISVRKQVEKERKLRRLRQKARNVLKDEMGVHISKDILYDDAYDIDDDTHSILSSHEQLDQLRRKRAACAADLSSEKPILLKRGGSRSRMKHKVKPSKKANGTGHGSKHHRRKASKRIAREFDFSGR